MALEMTCTIEGLDKIAGKLSLIGEGPRVQAALKTTALEMARKIKEVHQKGHYGNYDAEGEFHQSRLGGYSRQAWVGPKRVGPLSFQLVNPVKYVQEMFYAYRRTSDVVDGTYLQPGRKFSVVLDYLCVLFKKKLGAAIYQAIREAGLRI